MWQITNAEIALRKVVTGAALTGVASTGLMLTGPAAQAHGGEQCHRQTLNRTAYATTGFIRKPIMQTTMTLKWCGQNGRVTGFVVENYHNAVRDGLLLQTGTETSDIRPVNNLGSDRLYVNAVFGAKSTVLGFKHFSFGERTVRWNLQLRPNGVVLGNAYG